MDRLIMHRMSLPLLPRNPAWVQPALPVALLAVLACLAVTPDAGAQGEGPDSRVESDSVTVVQSYVQQALASNHALRQEEVDLERSFAALREARGAFLPSLDLEARYSRAEGGRTIDFPAGDLLNPAFSTLNDLTGSQQFPQTQNVEEPFLREEEQRTTLRFEQPIFVPKILHNYRANKDRVAAQKAAVEALRREVTRDVKVAYFNYLQAQRGVDVLQATEELTRENLRTNRSLMQRAKVTRDVVLRAKADMLEVRQQRIEAEKDRNLARSYLNFLMNRPLETPIETPSGFDRLPVPSGTPSSTDVVRTALGEPGDAAVWSTMRDAATNDLSSLQRQAVSNRPELDQLARTIQVAEQGVRAAQADYWPEVVLAVDAGIQGTNYRVDDDAPFVLGSVVLRWNLFNGFQDRSRVEQARLRQRRLESRHDELRRQIHMEVEEAQEQVRVVQTTLAAATERAQAARESFRLTRRRHEEGMANQVTLVDARTTLTDAELNLSASRYEYLKRLAELEYAVGTAGSYAASVGASARVRMRGDASTLPEPTATEPSDTTRYERFGLNPTQAGQ